MEHRVDITDLDDVVLHAVFARLDGQTLGQVACVCTAWRKVANDSRLWENLQGLLEHPGLVRSDVLSGQTHHRNSQQMVAGSCKRSLTTCMVTC